ncbi:hypothetical protein ARMGADRAFT_1073869 [Armillaria gallica]|uniref:Uncharacterized protein n=1 Tax=Armillaria gallica TaxID=47427 RepID=A0A2H3EI60_ARMGA|nr:hypothetical protein ARMGADRAFT_1073869 [Armillaria gallica]
MNYVGLPHPNLTSTELSDSLIQGVIIVAEPIVVEPMSLVTILTADSPPNETDDMDVPADDIPSQGNIWQLLEPAVAVVEATPTGTTPVDDALTLDSVHPQPVRFPARVARVASRLWSSPFLGSSTPTSLFTIIIAVLVGCAMGLFARNVIPTVPGQLAL